VATAEAVTVGRRLRPGSRWLQTIVAIAISVGLFWLAIARVDLGQLASVLNRVNLWFLLAAVGTYFVDLLVRALRWETLLRHTGVISARRLYPVLAIGYMANNLLPGRVGELSRAYLVGRRERVSGSAVLATVAVERVVDGLSVLGLLLGTLAVLPASGLVVAGWLGIVTRVAAITFGIALVGFAVLLIWRGVWLRLAYRAFGKLPDQLGRRLLALLDGFIEGLGALRHPRQIIEVLALSVLVWVVGAGTYILVAQSFGVGLPLLTALAMICLVNLATAIPQAPAGLGAFEAVASQSLVLLGVPGTLAFGVTIVLHAVLFAPVVVVGLFCLWRMNLSIIELGTKPT
jgi:uncharacterized protein (TIRG00374 family)